MLERLASWDRAGFYAINHVSSRFLDWLMPLLSDDGKFKIPFAIVFVAMLGFGKWRTRAAALLVIPLLVISDQTSSHFMKHAFERQRPCSALTDVRIRAGCGSSFSMPS